MKNRIREVMLKANLSQQDFATKLGVSPASISNIFMGRTNPTITHASAVHKAFPSVRMDWLLFGEGEMTDGEKSEDFDGTGGTNSDAPIEIGDDNLLVGEPSDASASSAFSVQKDVQAMPRSPQNGGVEQMQQMRQPMPNEIYDYANPNRLVAYNDMLNAKKCDKPERKVKEIRVFFDDGTYEIFIPAMK